jgi:SAM-dependent methyltransferase
VRSAPDTPMANHGASPPRCVWCERPFDARARQQRGRRVCPECGVATTDPWPDDAALKRAYAGWYRPASGRFAGPGDRLLRGTRGLLARRLARIAPPGMVLDVGAGDGGLLDALHARGRKAIGLERVSTRPDVHALDLDDLDVRFGAIVFWHSLEPLTAPSRTLRRAAELLLPGGLIVIALPNAGSLQASAFGDDWLALDLPRHLIHVPAGALLARLTALGLGVERVSHLRGGQIVFGWLHGLVGFLPRTPDLYDAIRRPAARQEAMDRPARAAAVVAGLVMLPAALALAGLEAVLRRGGSVYVEARKPA